MPKTILNMTSKKKLKTKTRQLAAPLGVSSFLTDVPPPPWQTCKRRRRGRYLSRQQAPNAKHPQFHPSTDIGPRRCVICANVLGSRSLTLWPRSVAMGRGRASSGAHLTSIPFFRSRTRRSVFLMRYRNTTEQPHGNLNDRRRPPPPSPPQHFCFADALNHQMHKLGPIAMGYFQMRTCGLAAPPSRHYDRSRALTINVSSPPTPRVLPARRTRFYCLRQHPTAIAVPWTHALFNASRRCRRLLLFKLRVERRLPAK
jgi:hypothetical protein